MRRSLRTSATEVTIETGETKRLSPEEIKDRGIKLRAEFDKTVGGLPDSGKAGHADEFTTIVLSYISAGMKLEDAVGILTAAGFSAPPRPRSHEEQDRNRETGWYVVVAEIPQFAGRVFGPVDVFVMLLPPDQGLAEFVGRRHRMMYQPRP